MTTHQERIEAVHTRIVKRMGQGMFTYQLATDIVDALFPRTPRPVQTSLGVVTYHEGEVHPWRMAWLENYPPASFRTLGQMVSAVCNAGTLLTDDDIERCIALPKAPWVEA